MEPIPATIGPTQPDGDRSERIASLLRGAVDLHCHSGPAAMPRILDHREAMQDAERAGFRALVYKDHFYLGVPHAVMLQKMYPASNLRLFSGLALNNASGGINPHAVDHAVAVGAKIVWMPTLSAANHIRVSAGEAKNFPRTSRRSLDPVPLTVLDGAGKVTDATKQVLDLIAEGDIILAGGHLHVSELFLLFEEARSRGVRKLLVNHPSYIVGCSLEDIASLAAMGAAIEHSIGMFIKGSAERHDAGYLKRLIASAGVGSTCLCSDLGLQGAPRPIEGYRLIVAMLLDLDYSDNEIRALVGDNAAGLLSL